MKVRGGSAEGAGVAGVNKVTAAPLLACKALISVPPLASS